MLSLRDVARQHSALSDDDLDHLEALVGEWDLLADAGFADLILWIPGEDPDVFWAAAQTRPTTAPTALDHSLVGDDLSYEADSPVTEAFFSGQVACTSDNNLHAGIPVEQHAIPVRRNGRTIAVVDMHSNQMGVRVVGALEESYLALADILRSMVLHGEFPSSGQKWLPWMSPRIADGSLWVGPSGEVHFASPNAVAAFRRLGYAGELRGEAFANVAAALPHEARVPTERAVCGRLRETVEFDLDSNDGSIHLRVQPLMVEGEPAGFLAMCRDTTELRARERQLVRKDATIREIHHRVKNNLQTVSALLRLQERRSGSPDAREALADAQRRVAAIAVVHEILSQGLDTAVPFDEVADRVVSIVRDAQKGVHLTFERRGSFGRVPAEAATGLSLIVMELAQSLVDEHAAEGGTAVIEADSDQDSLLLRVGVEGRPLPRWMAEDHRQHLGLSIAETLTADLRGAFRFESSPEGASWVRVEIPLR